MEAVFALGSAIRAKDLNEDFDQLRFAIQEGADYSSQNETDIDGLDVRVTKNEADTSALDVRVTQNEGDITNLYGQTGDLATRVGQNETDIAQNKTDIAQNKADIVA